MVGDVAAVPTAVVDVHVDVVEGGDGASKHSLLNPPRCVLASADVLADLFFTIVRHQSFTYKMSGHTDQCCIIPLVV